MCQSKAEGGIRCHSHAHEALAASTDRHVALVVSKSEEIMGKKLPTARESFDDTNPSDHMKLNVMLSEEKGLAKLKAESEHLGEDVRNAYAGINEGHRNGDWRQIYRAISVTDPETAELVQKRDELRSAYHKNAEEARNEGDTNMLRVLAVQHSSESGEVSEKIESRNALIEREAKVIANLSRLPDGAPVNKHPKFRIPTAVRNLQQEFLDTREKARNLEAEKKEFYKTRIGGYNLKQTEAFKQVATSPKFTTSNEYRDWRKKDAVARGDYAITTTSLNNLKAKVEDAPRGSEQRLNLQAKYDQLVNVRNVKITNNKKAALANA
jgi:hypothetical protein